MEKDLIKLLKDNEDLSTVSSDDMSIIDPGVTCHQIPSQAAHPANLNHFQVALFAYSRATPIPMLPYALANHVLQYVQVVHLRPLILNLEGNSLI